MYIQSFYQYPVTFSSIGKTIPARSAQGELRNVAEFTEKEIDILEKSEPFFRELKDKKKIRVLNHLPASYVPPAQRINEAKDEADKLRQENEALKAKLAALESGKAPAEDDGLEGDRGRDAVAGVDEAPAEDDGYVETVTYEASDYKDLQKDAKERGINPNQKKAALIAELKKYDAEHASE